MQDIETCDLTLFEGMQVFFESSLLKSQKSR